jgi:hypothetical protein
MTTAAALLDAARTHSVFAGANVCQQAGLRLPDTARPVMFDEDMWDFTEVIGLPTQLAPVNRRFNFTAIINPRWRLVAKELILALLAPRHQAVAPLSRAYRTPLHLRTARGRLAELTRLLNWLTDQGISSLGEVDADRCEQYLAHRRYVRDNNDVMVGERGPAVRRAAAQIVVDLVNHGELFTTDRLPEHLRPWAGRLRPSLPRCATARSTTRPRRSTTPSCSHCWPPPPT